MIAGPVDVPYIVMGHSRGGNLMALSAAAFPERETCLVSFDGVLGLSGTHPVNTQATQLLVKYRPTLFDRLPEITGNQERESEVAQRQLRCGAEDS